MGLGNLYHAIESRLDYEKDSIHRVHAPDQLQHIMTTFVSVTLLEASPLNLVQYNTNKLNLDVYECSPE